MINTRRDADSPRAGHVIEKLTNQLDDLGLSRQEDIMRAGLRQHGAAVDDLVAELTDGTLGPRLDLLVQRLGSRFVRFVEVFVVRKTEPEIVGW